MNIATPRSVRPWASRRPARGCGCPTSRAASGVDAELRRARLDQRQRGLRALLHHVAELAGQDQPAVAGHARGLDEQDVAADRRPGEAGRDAGHAGAHRHLGLELARRRGSPRRSAASIAHAASASPSAMRTAAWRSSVADLALEVAHAGLARVVVDDRARSASSVISHCSASRPVAASWRGTQVAARDLQLLLRACSPAAG